MRDYLGKNKFLHRDYAREKYYNDPYSKAKADIKLREELIKLNQQREMRERLKKAIESGIIKTGINEEKFNKHVKGTYEYETYKRNSLAKDKHVPSYLTITRDEAQKLVDRYSGTGQFKYLMNEEMIPGKEILEHSGPIGVYIERGTGEETITRFFRIHYSNTGVHIVPTRRRKK